MAVTSWKSSLLEVAKAAGTIDVGDHDTLVNRTHDQRVHIASTENEGREPLDVTANGEEMNSVGILNDGNRAIRLSPEPFRQVAVVDLTIAVPRECASKRSPEYKFR